VRKYKRKICILREHIDKLWRDKGMEDHNKLEASSFKFKCNSWCGCNDDKDMDGGDDDKSSSSDATDEQPIDNNDDDNNNDDHDDGTNTDRSDKDSNEIAPIQNEKRKRAIIKVESDSEDSSRFGDLDHDKNHEGTYDNSTHDDGMLRIWNIGYLHILLTNPL
jgi:hypothetical protein